MALDKTFPNIDLSTYQGVLLDLDDTLYDYQDMHPKALLACYNTFRNFWTQTGLDYCTMEELYTDYRSQITKRLNFGSSCRSRLFAFQEILTNLKTSRPYDLAIQLEDCYWNYFLQNITVYPSALKFLEKIKAHSLPVCLITDMQHHYQIKKVLALKIDSYIDHIVSSDIVGVEKPDALIFSAALATLKVNADQVIMIGDSKEKDQVGATNLGIKCYLV